MSAIPDNVDVTVSRGQIEFDYSVTPDYRGMVGEKGVIHLRPVFPARRRVYTYWRDPATGQKMGCWAWEPA